MDFDTLTFDVPELPEDTNQTPIDWSGKIAENQTAFGQCDVDTAANIINNEEELDAPATYYMFNPVETDPNGAIKQKELKKYYDQQNLNGVISTLANARLYPVYNSYREEAAKKEYEYKQGIFDESSFVNKLKNDLPASWYGMKRNELVYKKAKAEEEGDDELAQEYDYEIGQLDEELEQYMQDDGVISATASFLTSMARNPELFAVGLAAGLVSGGTGSAIAVGALASAAEGAIIYNDTKKVEAGEMLQTLEEKYPNLSKEERLEIAEAYGSEAAGIEAITSLLTPVGMAARGLTRVGRKAVTGTINRGRIKTISEAGKETLLKRIMEREGAKKAITNPNKIAYIGKIVAEHVLGASAEAGQEVSQKILEDAYLKALEDVEDPTKENLWENALDSLKDDTKVNQYAKLFYETWMASLIVSGTGAAVSRTASAGYNKLMAKSAAVDAEKASQNMLETKKNSEVYKKSPKAYNEQTEILVDVGSAPEQVVFSDVSALRKIKEEAEASGNTDILERLEKAGITEEAMTQAEETTGDLKIDFTKFDEHILDPDNEELFQKVKGLYTFDETTLTKREMKEILSDVIERRPELETAIKDTESVFNKTIEALSKRKNVTPAMAIDQAILAQLKENRALEFEGKTPEEARKVGLEIINTKEGLLDKAKGLFQRVKADIETNQFKKWFADSKVADENNKPITVFRGDTTDIEVFDEKYQRGGNLGKAFYFTTDEGYAEQYSGLKETGRKPEQYYLSIKNPLMVGKEGYVKAVLNKFPEAGKLTTHDQIKNFLKSKGIDGIIWNRGNKTEYAVFNSKQIKSIYNNGEFSESPNVLKQQQAGHIAGVYTREGDKDIIKLTEYTNPTTLIHELDHRWWKQALESYNSGNMIPYWKKQVEAAAKWVGAEVIDGKLDFTTEQIEKLADGFTTYLKEGKAPIESLSDLFARIAEWFMDVYKKLKMSGVRLNKEITEVFDAMLISREEIDNALVDKRVQAIGRKKGVTEEQYQRYISDLSVLRHQSTTKQIEAIRKKARTEIEEKYREKKAEIRGQVEAELAKDREYQLRAAIRNQRIAVQDIPADLKLKNKELFVAEDGLPADQFITEFGDVVSNVGDLVDLLNRLRAPSAVVEEKTNELFDEWLMNNNPELTEVDAKIATANKNLIRVRVKEYLMLKGIPLDRFEEYYNTLIKAADEEINNMPISYFINTYMLMFLQTKITTKARFAKNDSELADALWHQAAADYMLAKAKEIKGKVLNFQKHFDKYKKAQTDADRQRMDAKDFDMLAAILYNFRFTGRKPRVRDIPLGSRIDSWINNKLENRFSDADIVTDYTQFLSQDRGTKAFNKMTYEDFGRINQMARLIEAISRADKVKTETDKKMKRADDADKWVDYLAKNKINLSAGSWWTGNVTMTETLLESTMPRDLYEEYVLREVDAINKRELRMSKNDKALKEPLTRVVENKGKMFKIKLANKNINMTYEDLFVAALNSDNMETWIASYNKQHGMDLTLDDFIDIVSQAPEQMWKDAKVIWDIFDSQKQEFREAQYRTSGFLMDFVEPRKITLRNGREIQTGYYPRSKRYSAGEFDAVVQSSFNNNGKNMGTAANAKDRMETGTHTDLDLTLNSIRSHLYHIATVIEVGPLYNALNSLFNNDGVRLAVGEKAYNTLNDWTRYPLVGDHVNKLFSGLDQLSSIQILGWAPKKFIVQALGFIPALRTVGLRWAAPHFLEAKTYTDLFSLNKIKELSTYMRLRYEEADKYIANVTDDYRMVKLGRTLKDRIFPIAMMFTARGDAFASGIVWRGSYERALAEGKTQEQAILWADHVVRTTQGDSSLVSRPPILRGNTRFLTKFASYFIAQNSRITSNIVGRKYLQAVADLMLAGVVGGVVEAVIGAAYDYAVESILSAIGLGDDKEKKKMEDFEEYALDKAKKNLWMTLGALSIPVGGFGSTIGTYIAYGKRYPNELPMFGYAGAIMDSVKYSIALLQADTEKEKAKAKKGLIKATGQVLTIPKKYVNMLITD